MADATAKLSELLSAAGGCRTLDDALGSPRREPSFLDKASDGSSSDPDSGQSPELSASMRLVRSYAARVKQMPPWLPEPATFGGRRRQSLPVSREEWLEPSRSTLRPTYFSPERVPNVLIKSAEARLTRLTRLINEDIPLLRTRSDESRPLRRLSTGAISTVLHGCPPAAQGGLQCRFLALIPAGEDADTADKADKTVTRAITDVAPSASRHWAVQRRKSSTDISSTGSNSANSSNSSNSSLMTHFSRAAAPQSPGGGYIRDIPGSTRRRGGRACGVCRRRRSLCAAHSLLTGRNAMFRKP